jgi:CRP/FNR family transcriptional regulator, cyclic AMP receptor protein
VNFLSNSDFVRYISEHSDAALKAAVQLTENCHAAQEEIRCIGLSTSVEEKIARLLMGWAESSHSAGCEPSFKVPYKHEEIAQMIGSTRETVTRILGNLKRKKVIEIRGATLVVRDQPRLKQLAGR